MRILLLFLTTLFLSACNSTQGVSVYSFTSSEVESVLGKQLPKLSEKVSLMGLPVQFDVNDLSVNIGPDNRDVVVLGADSSAEINAFALKYPVRLKLQIEGSPFYIGRAQFEYWRHTQLIIDVVDGRGGMFSLEGPEGKRFLTRSRIFTDDEWNALKYAEQGNEQSKTEART